MPVISKVWPKVLADADDAVLVRLLGRHLLDRDDVAAVALVGVEHLLHAAAAQHVGQQHREGLVADDLAGAPDRVAEAERRLLAGEAGLAGRRQVALQRLVVLGLAALLQRRVELEGDVEMVLDHRLVAAGDEDEMLDAGLARLVDHVLDDRPVDDGQHLLRHGLGGGQEAGAEAGDGQDGLADGFHRAGPGIEAR